MRNIETFYTNDEVKASIDRFHKQLGWLSHSKVLQMLVAKGLEGYREEWRKTGAINIEMPDFEWFE
jgi:hypothetical protein